MITGATTYGYLFAQAPHLPDRYEKEVVVLIVVEVLVGDGLSGGKM